MKKASRLFLATVFLLGSLMLAIATEEQAREAAAQAREQLRDLGFQVRNTYRTGALDRGNSTVFTRTFYQDNEYVLVVTGCAYARDIDVFVFDDDGSLIAQDSKSSPTSVATFQANYTGKYFIKVVMYDATSAQNVHYAFQYGYR